MHNKSPFLYFNFQQTKQKNSSSPFYFEKPKKVIMTYAIDNVLSCLKLVQQYVENGNYAAGYLSYEAAPAFHTDISGKENFEMPLLWFGIFTSPQVYQAQSKSQQNYHFTEWEANMPFEKYYHNFHKIHEYLKQGKTEQVNYTIRLAAEFTGDSFAYFKKLEHAQAAQYNAYLHIGDYSILSASPELFFHKNDGVITMKPMKGTVHRGKTYEEDLQNKKWLQTSKKNRNENEMITNLMCNELKRISQPQTIQITKPFAIEKYPTVYQMTSTIQAKLKRQKNFIDIFKALFPCGSITGTEKQETMKIIHELESDPREVYCGAIGYITPEQEAFFNVPIRTVTIHEATNKAHFGVGGGITLQSHPEEEYKEIFTKSELLTYEQPEFQLLESFGLTNGNYIVYQHHINRLQQSAEYFSFVIDLPKVEKQLKIIEQTYATGYWKVRLVIHKCGKFSTEVSPLKIPTNKTIHATIAQEPIDQNNVFLYHKTTFREMYDKHRRNQQDSFDTLLWNQNKEVTEFTMGNLVADIHGELITPPVSCGLLPGTFREKLLKEGKINEAVITIEDLNKSSKIWFINSVRKWLPIDFHL